VGTFDGGKRTGKRKLKRGEIGGTVSPRPGENNLGGKGMRVDDKLATKGPRNSAKHPGGIGKKKNLSKVPGKLTIALLGVGSPKRGMTKKGKRGGQSLEKRTGIKAGKHSRLRDKKVRKDKSEQHQTKSRDGKT